MVESWRRRRVEAMPNQCGNRFIILKSSPARPGADTERQKPLRDTDIPSSANSLAEAMCLYVAVVTVLKSYLAVDHHSVCHGYPSCQINLS